MVLHRETEEEIVGEFADLTAGSTRSEAFDSLVELNGQCLELLADQAYAQPTPGSLLLRQVGDIWRTLDAAARRRAASCPYLLVDAGFSDPSRWRRLRARCLCMRGTWRNRRTRRRSYFWGCPCTARISSARARCRRSIRLPSAIRSGYARGGRAR